MPTTSAVDVLLIVFEAVPEDEREEAFERLSKRRLEHLAGEESEDFPPAAIAAPRRQGGRPHADRHRVPSYSLGPDDDGPVLAHYTERVSALGDRLQPAAYTLELLPKLGPQLPTARSVPEADGRGRKTTASVGGGLEGRARQERRPVRSDRDPLTARSRASVLKSLEPFNAPSEAESLIVMG